MTDEEYRDFVAQVNADKLLIGIDRAVARQFYTDIPLSKIREETGEPPYVEKQVVWLAFSVGPTALLASIVLSVPAFRWWALLLIPLTIILYLFYAGQSSMPHRGMLGITIVLGFVLGNLLVGFLGSVWLRWFVAALAIALWSSRLTYCAADVFLRAFVLRNKRALDLMWEHIRVKQASG